MDMTKILDLFSVVVRRISYLDKIYHIIKAKVHQPTGLGGGVRVNCIDKNAMNGHLGACNTFVDE